MQPTPVRSPVAERALEQPAAAPDDDNMTHLGELTKEELIRVVQRKAQQIQKYQAKFSDLVTAYKAAQAGKEKVEKMLETQQDDTMRRIRELQEAHRRDGEAKDKLVEALKSRVAEKDELIRRRDQDSTQGQPQSAPPASNGAAEQTIADLQRELKEARESAANVRQVRMARLALDASAAIFYLPLCQEPLQSADAQVSEDFTVKINALTEELARAQQSVAETSAALLSTQQNLSAANDVTHAMIRIFVLY